MYVSVKSELYKKCKFCQNNLLLQVKCIVEYFDEINACTSICKNEMGDTINIKSTE